MSKKPIPNKSMYTPKQILFTAGVLIGNFFFVVPSLKALYKKINYGKEEITHVVWLKLTYDQIPLGEIDIGLYGNLAPKNINNFLSLVEGVNDLTYKGVPFHMVVPKYLIATGDVVNKNGTGHFSIYDNKFVEDEISKSTKFNNAGVVAMCNTGLKDTNGSQFFITLDNLPFLNEKHTIIGRVIDGLDLIHAIADTHGNLNGTPNADFHIQDIGLYNYDEYIANKKSRV